MNRDQGVLRLTCDYLPREQPFPKYLCEPKQEFPNNKEGGDINSVKWSSSLELEEMLQNSLLHHLSGPGVRTSVSSPASSWFDKLPASAAEITAKVTEVKDVKDLRTGQGDLTVELTYRRGELIWSPVPFRTYCQTFRCDKALPHCPNNSLIPH